MPSKLKFKGDTKSRKRKRADNDNGNGKGKDDGNGKNAADNNVDDGTWVLPDQPNEVRGPCFLFHPVSTICLTFNLTANKLILSTLPEKREPTDVSQVWVVTRLSGSDTINLRTGTGEGKFLSCDKHGLVTADRDARGPQEEWSIVLLPDGMAAFHNLYDKYLSVDEVAGGTLALRGDSEKIGPSETFCVKVQAKYKREACEEDKKQKEGIAQPTTDETESNAIFQTWGAGRRIISHEDKKEIKKAKKEGRLAEAMLDRRSKLKNDRFC